MRVRHGRGARSPWGTELRPPAIEIEFMQLRDSKGAVCTGCGGRYEISGDPEVDAPLAYRHASGQCVPTVARPAVVA